ncbi:MAG: L-tyrosine/L-tryptophan isonitrile synthase family protein [Marinobacter sp.]
MTQRKINKLSMNSKVIFTCSPTLQQVSTQIDLYLKNVMDSFACNENDNSSSIIENPNQKIFDILTSRRYCYLSKKQASEFSSKTIKSIGKFTDKNKPVNFYYDLGGGYRATTLPGQTNLNYEVGLGELLALHQVALFSREIKNIYPPGAYFYIVIDNLCALFTNDISLDNTSHYIDQLRQLLYQTKLNDRVALLVESETFPVSGYHAEFIKNSQKTANISLTSAEHENVNRFLGRECDKKEAIERVMRYQSASEATESLIQPFINGIRLTQRANQNTLCFRSFKGGDQRIQAGSMALSLEPGGKIKPILLTSRNIDRYERISLPAPNFLPKIISEIIFARPIHTQSK